MFRESLPDDALVHAFALGLRPDPVGTGPTCQDPTCQDRRILPPKTLNSRVPEILRLTAQMLKLYGRQAEAGLPAGPICGFRLADGRFAGGSFF